MQRTSEEHAEVRRRHEQEIVKCRDQLQQVNFQLKELKGRQSKLSQRWSGYEQQIRRLRELQVSALCARAWVLCF